MRTWNKGTTRAALFTAGFVALGAGSVCPPAAFGDTTNGDHSLLGGDQISAPISVPIDISGDSVAVAGAARSRSKGGAKAGGHGHGGGRGGGRWTSGRHSVLGGDQVGVPVSVPVDMCGNAAGDAFAGCKGGAVAKGDQGPGGRRTSGDHSVGGGDQVDIPVKVPVNVCGNAVAVLGDAVAGCAGGVGGHPGPGDGGYGHCGCGHGGYGATGHGGRVLRSPATTVLRGLPVVSQQAKAVSLSQGTTMPALPPLPAPGTHGDPRLPVLTEQTVKGLPAHARTVTMSGHEVRPPEPVPPGAPVRTPLGSSLPVRVPEPPGKVAHAQAARAVNPRAVNRGLPKPPAGADLTPPRADVHDPFAPVTEPVTELAPMAADDLLGDGMKAGLTYILGVGALLAGAAAAMASSRRIRFGRR
jgi:hypothetical protein